MFSTRFELISSFFAALAVLEAQTIVYVDACDTDFYSDDAVAQNTLRGEFSSLAGSLAAELWRAEVDKNGICRSTSIFGINGHYHNMLKALRLFDGDEDIILNPSEVQAAKDTVARHLHMQAEGNAECSHD
jgi:hypothetical protein